MPKSSEVREMACQLMPNGHRWRVLPFLSDALTGWLCHCIQCAQCGSTVIKKVSGKK